MKGRPRLIVRLDPGALSELRSQAKAEGVTLSAYVRQILYDFLELYS